MSRMHWTTILGAGLLASCGEAEVSTADIERAAIERTRQELALPADTALDATVWTGQEHEGEVTYCGTVSSPEGAAPAIAPRRFAAVGDPFRFAVFEGAHDPIVTSQPDKFLSFEQLCARQQAA